MLLHILSDKIATNALTGIRRILVVRQLRLVEIGSAILAVPLKQVTQVMLRHEAIANDVVAVHLNASFAWVSSVFDGTFDIVVGTPQPSVIDDNITAVDLHHVLSLD